MSYTLHPLKKQRLHRSELAVPGSNPTMIEKAAESEVDVIFFDLEDAVAPPDKVQARANIIQALNDIDWKAKGKTVSIRINGLDTHYMYRDVVEIVEQAGQYLDTILVPKVGVPADLYTVETMVSQIEAATDLTHRIGIEALIETALGMANVEAIASAPGRLEALHFGVADYAASNRARTVVIGGLNPRLSRRSVAFRAVAHDRRLPRLRAARHRRAVRRFLAIPTATSFRPSAPPPSGSRANGPSIPARSNWPTRCSRRPRPR